ncbi:unnamed protein product [Ranitomeya imitator]|uniref:40S ribosomal protein S11 n=1 Tax=Ranitomeya imitator TaxID=111125 RepID=A0ABN9LAI4_9NEOB|nr:unnamed protein product [Ranitomeya imitator]
MWMASHPDNSSVIKNFKAHGTVPNLPRCGRKRKIDKRFQRKIVRMLDKEPRLTCKQVQAALQSEGTTVSTRTIHRHLNEKGLYEQEARASWGDRQRETTPLLEQCWSGIQEAIEGTYIDKKCPFTGNVSIRGGILSGVVTKLKMQRTVVIRRDYLLYIRKYNHFEKRHKNMSGHLSPCFRDVLIGDIITIGECCPLSKTVCFNVLKVTKAAGIKKQFQKL